MVPFAGYAMALNYTAGIIKEHLHTRERAGLFDVSHMGQILIRGDDIARQLETSMPVDLIGLTPGRQKYGLLLNQAGGVLDDLMVINRGEEFVLVVNAACKQQDLAYLQSSLGEHLDISLLENKALIALQGPFAAEALANVCEADSGSESAIRQKLGAFKFMQVRDFKLCGTECMVSRSGYTGEDGFEFSLNADRALALCQQLLAHESVELAGLGARDSLRMEAGLCLYGQDMNPQVTPIQAGLHWAISPARRRGGPREGGFPGAEIILEQMAGGAAKKLVGLMPEGRAPMRQGTRLFDETQRPVGEITSGGFSPSLQRPISMGFVAQGANAPGTTLPGVGQRKVSSPAGDRPSVLSPALLSIVECCPFNYYLGESR